MGKIEPRSAVVTIYQGDYLDRLRFLERQYDAAIKAEESSERVLAEVPASEALFEEHAALKAEADETALHLTLFALGRRQWRALVKEHPPRKDNADDEGMGVNEESFKDALVPASLVYPLGHDNEGQEQIDAEDLDRLSDIDFDRAYYTAFALNRSPAADPKGLARPASQQSRPSDES